MKIQDDKYEKRNKWSEKKNGMIQVLLRNMENTLLALD